MFIDSGGPQENIVIFVHIGPFFFVHFFIFILASRTTSNLSPLSCPVCVAVHGLDLSS